MTELAAMFLFGYLIGRMTRRQRPKLQFDTRWMKWQEQKQNQDGYQRRN